MIKKPVGLGPCLYRAGQAGPRNSAPCIVLYSIAYHVANKTMHKDLLRECL